MSQTGSHCGDCLKDKSGRKHIWPKHIYLETRRTLRDGMEIRREARCPIKDRDEQPHFKAQSYSKTGPKAGVSEPTNPVGFLAFIP